MYLLVTEDLEVHVYSAYDKSWPESVADGIIFVIRAKDGVFEDLQSDGTWLEIPES